MPWCQHSLGDPPLVGKNFLWAMLSGEELGLEFCSETGGFYVELFFFFFKKVKLERKSQKTPTLGCGFVFTYYSCAHLVFAKSQAPWEQLTGVWVFTFGDALRFPPYLKEKRTERGNSCGA